MFSKKLESGHFVGVNKNSYGILLQLTNNEEQVRILLTKEEAERLAELIKEYASLV
jgi:hypothetical protein